MQKSQIMSVTRPINMLCHLKVGFYFLVRQTESEIDVEYGPITCFRKRERNYQDHKASEIFSTMK